MPRTNVVNAFDDTLTSTLAAGAGTMLVDNPGGFPATPFYAVIEPLEDGNREYVKATAPDTGGFIVDRNLAGSVGDVEHLAGATVRVAIVAQHISDVWDGLDGAGDFKSDGSVDMTQSIKFDSFGAGLKYQNEPGERILLNSSRTQVTAPDGSGSIQVSNTGITLSRPLDMNQLPGGDQRIVNLKDPDNPQDAATKQYVDDSAGGGDFKSDGSVDMTASIVMGTTDAFAGGIKHGTEGTHRWYQTSTYTRILGPNGDEQLTVYVDRTELSGPLKILNDDISFSASGNGLKYQSEATNRVLLESSSVALLSPNGFSKLNLSDSVFSLTSTGGGTPLTIDIGSGGGSLAKFRIAPGFNVQLNSGNGSLLNYTESNGRLELGHSGSKTLLQETITELKQVVTKEWVEANFSPL